MAVTLNERGYVRARELIEQGRYVLDGRVAWSEHQPSTEEENEFIAAHGIGEYAKWHLGVDDEEPPERKGRYKFPYGDFDKVPASSRSTSRRRGTALSGSTGTAAFDVSNGTPVDTSAR